MYRKEEKEKVVVERYPYKTTNSLNEGLLASVAFLYAIENFVFCTK